MLGKRAQNILHRLGGIDFFHLAAERLLPPGQILRGIVLELFEIDAVLCNLAEHLAVGRARYAEANRKRRTVARQADHPHIMTKVFAAELRADAERLRHLQYFLLHLEIAEGVAVGRAMSRPRVEIAGRGENHRLRHRSRTAPACYWRCFSPHTSTAAPPANSADCGASTRRARPRSARPH